MYSPTEETNPEENIELQSLIQENSLLDFEEKTLEEEFELIKKNMHGVIGGMREDHSIIATMARNWGPKPLWLKILIALFILLPITGLGIYASFTGVSATLLVVIVVSAVITACVFGGYCLWSWLLGDHHSDEKKVQDSLDEGMDAVVDIYSDISLDMQDAELKLSAEVGIMGSENNRYGEQLNDLTQEKTKYKANTTRLAGVSEHFGQLVKKDIKTAAQKFTSTVQEKERLLAEARQQSEDERCSHQKIMQELQQDLNTIKTLNMALEGELTQSRETCRILSGTATDMQDLQKNYEAKSQQNMQEMEDIVQQQTALAQHHKEQFSDALGDFSGLNKQYTKKVDDYEQLVAGKQTLLGRLNMHGQSLVDSWEGDPAIANACMKRGPYG